jgi:uncharacterized sulfatase
MKIRSSLFGLLLMCVSSAAFAAADKPNVLFIAVDDMNNDLGTYGNSVIKSPAIDALATRGLRFDRAYCQFPFCGPSRASVMTGLRPDRTRVFDLKYNFRQELPDVVTLPQLFMRHGYYTARVGKIYHYSNPGGIGTSGLDDPASWHRVVNPAGRDKTELESKVTNYTPDIPSGLGAALAFYADPDGRDEEHTDGLVATEAIKIMEAHRDRPFFLGVGFYKPHCPYIAPQRYFDLYPLEKITLPDEPPGHLERVPESALRSTSPRPTMGITPAQAHEVKRAYYATISFVDAQIGRVLAALERLGLAEKTIVVFWSDHGYHLGEHGMWHKKSLFEESARVPLIIAAPGVGVRGRASSRTVELIDLYPTLAALAGLAPPAELQGANLVPLLENPLAPWARAAYSQVQPGAFPGWSVRTERWRYTEWDGGKRGAELYDHDRDPREYENLANDPKFAGVVAEMKTLVKKNWPKPVTAGKGPDKPSP